MVEPKTRAYPAELEELVGELSRMGGEVEDMLADALHAIERSDHNLAEQIVNRDSRVDNIQLDVEDRVLTILSGRQRKPVDLRLTVAALKVAGDLERIGDLAKNIARRVTAIGKLEKNDRVLSILRMGRLVVVQLKRVLDAFSAQDPVEAAEVWKRDTEVDEHYNAIFRVLLTYMMEDPRTIGECTHLLFMAKNMERAGDHCTNIAETIHFFVTGEKMTTQRPKSDEL